MRILLKVIHKMLEKVVDLLLRQSFYWLSRLNASEARDRQGVGLEEVYNLREGDLQDFLEGNLLEGVVLPLYIQMQPVPGVFPHSRDGKLQLPQLQSQG